MISRACRLIPKKRSASFRLTRTSSKIPRVLPAAWPVDRMRIRRSCQISMSESIAAKMKIHDAPIPLSSGPPAIGPMSRPNAAGVSPNSRIAFINAVRETVFGTNAWKAGCSMPAHKKPFKTAKTMRCHTSTSPAKDNAAKPSACPICRRRPATEWV